MRMNRFVASALGVLVIAGALYRPPMTDLGSIPRGTPERTIQTGGQTAKQQPRAAGASLPPSQSNPCGETSGPWSKIIEYFRGEKSPSARAPGWLKKDLAVGSTRYGFQ